MSNLKIQGEVAAPLESVWALYSDHRGWVRWAGVQEVVMRCPGEPAPDGIGATSVMRSRGIAVESEIVAFEPPTRIAYRMVGGLPIRDHQAEVRFEPVGENTRVVWSVRFRPWLPGTGPLIESIMRRELEEILRRLIVYPYETLSEQTLSEKKESALGG